jgi:3D (Asp-Asp-Asp) domain-containing protein
MTKNTTYNLISSFKTWSFVVIVAILASCLISSDVLAKESEKLLAITPVDQYFGLYYRQIKAKELKLTREVKKTASVAVAAEKKPAKKAAAVRLAFNKIEKPLLADVAANTTTEDTAGKIPESEKPDKKVNAVITAYTSTPDQTDDSPFIAATGKRVYDGMIAANWLPFGTKVKIPALYGDKIFTVDDRMNKRYGYGRMDIWLDATRTEALQFGVKRVVVEVFYKKKQPVELSLAK